MPSPSTSASVTLFISRGSVLGKPAIFCGQPARNVNNAAVVAPDPRRDQPEPAPAGASSRAVLRALGAFLRGHLRGSDLACRYGGEEFGVILPRTMLADAGRIADHIREAIAAKIAQ